MEGVEEGGVVVRPSRFRRVCVFCGSSAGKRNCYQDAAVELGKELVYTLAYFLPSPCLQLHFCIAFSYSAAMVAWPALLRGVFSFGICRFPGRWTWCMVEEVWDSWALSLKLSTLVVVMFLGTLNVNPFHYFSAMLKSFADIL